MSGIEDIKTLLGMLLVVVAGAFLIGFMLVVGHPKLRGESVAPICRDNGGVRTVATKDFFGTTVQALVVCKDGSVERLS